MTETAASPVENINGFNFVCYIPPVLDGASREAMTRVARSLYAKMLEVLDASGFQNESELQLKVADRGFELDYTDADLGFTLTALSDRLILRRSGSSLNRFDYWYRQLMPS